MPDEKENYRAAQSEHAQKMRTERAVMDMTGASRSQIRAALTTFAQRQLAARLFAAPAEPAPKPEPLPTLSAPEQKFEPRPFVLAPEGAKHGGAEPFHEEGSADTPYVMGTDRTTGLDECADDEWDVNDQPDGYDGVRFNSDRRYYALSTEGVWVFTDDSSTPRGWYATQYQTFYRIFTYDSAGKLKHISVEYFGEIVTKATFNAT